MSYTIAKAMLTIKQIELIKKKKFAKATIDEKSKIFVIQIVVPKVSLVKTLIYSD